MAGVSHLYIIDLDMIDWLLTKVGSNQYLIIIFYLSVSSFSASLAASLSLLWPPPCLQFLASNVETTYFQTPFFLKQLNDHCVSTLCTSWWSNTPSLKVKMGKPPVPSLMHTPLNSNNKLRPTLIVEGVWVISSSSPGTWRDMSKAPMNTRTMCRVRWLL